MSSLLATPGAPKRRVTTALRIDTPRLRIEAQDDPVAVEQEAAAEEEQTAHEERAPQRAVTHPKR